MQRPSSRGDYTRTPVGASFGKNDDDGGGGAGAVAGAGGGRSGHLGVLSGVGLVMANMVGVGVLTTTGYMAGQLGPWTILLAWLAGGALAMAGARCYAEIAAIIPRSGGEYRYLSDLLHPFLGYLAGWTSLLVGFSAPVAVAAATAGPFFITL